MPPVSRHIRTRYSYVREEAEKLIKAEETYKKIQRSSNGRESAMSDTRLLEAQAVFSHKVEPRYLSTYNTFGSNDIQRTASIECEIREFIVQQICTEAQEAIRMGQNVGDNNYILNFVRQNYHQLKNGEQSAMREARSLFIDNDKTAQVAWRNYDAKAPTSQWDNLLAIPINMRGAQRYMTNPSQEMASDTSLGTNSDELRKRVAYAWIASKDTGTAEGQITPEIQQLMQANILGQLRDIRRAHNDNLRGIDSPSCIPGAYGRIYAMGAGHPITKPIEKAKDHLPGIMAKIVNEKYIQTLQRLTTTEEKSNLYNSLIMLEARNAKDILRNVTMYKPEWLTIRKNFINSLGSSETIFRQVNQILSQEGITALDRNSLSDKAAFDYALLNIGANGTTAQNLKDALDRSIGVVPPATSTYAEVERQEIINPFQAHQQDKKQLFDKMKPLVAQELGASKSIDDLRSFLTWLTVEIFSSNVTETKLQQLLDTPWDFTNAEGSLICDENSAFKKTFAHNLFSCLKPPQANPIAASNSAAIPIEPVVQAQPTGIRATLPSLPAVRPVRQRSHSAAIPIEPVVQAQPTVIRATLPSLPAVRPIRQRSHSAPPRLGDTSSRSNLAYQKHLRNQQLAREKPKFIRL